MNLRRLAEMLDMSRAEQAVVLALLTFLLAGSVSRTWREGARLRSGVTVVRSPRAAAARIDLNRAAWHDLVVLPGIGPKRARQIVALRDQVHAGRFVALAQIAEVKGISTSIVDRIRPYVYLSQDGGRD